MNNHNSSRVIPIRNVENWIESVLDVIGEIFSQIRNNEYLIQDVAISEKRDSLSSSILESKISELQSKLFDAEKKIKSIENQKYVIGNY